MRLKNARLVKSLSILILFTVLLQCFPTATSAFELKDLKDSVRTFVEKRDNSLNTIKNTVNKYYNLTDTITTKFVRGGVSTLESKKGVNSENKLYNIVKDYSLEKIGIKLGGGKALKDTGLFAIDLGAKILTLPIGIVDLGYKIKDNPQKYKESLSNGAKTIAGVILNPLPVAKKLYQDLVTVPDVAKHDPLEMGKLRGEFGTYGAMAVLPAGNVKMPSALKKVLSTAKTSTLTKTSALANKIDFGISLPNINLGFAPSPVLAGSVRGTGGSSAIKSVTSSVEKAGKKSNALLTFKVGDIFDGVKITAKKGNTLTWGKKTLYENTLIRPGEDILAPINYVKLSIKDGKLYNGLGEKADGAYLYVLDHKDKLLVAKAEKYIHHSHLGKGKPVQLAGTFVAEEGELLFFTNISGHYKPAITAFKNVLPTLQKYLPDLTEGKYHGAILKNVK
ncbi:MAG: hypothetical protein ACOX2X_06465 [Peptococcia bacterium]|jgi:hypothetical protein